MVSLSIVTTGLTDKLSCIVLYCEIWDVIKSVYFLSWFSLIFLRCQIQLFPAPVGTHLRAGLVRSEEKSEIVIGGSLKCKTLLETELSLPATVLGVGYYCVHLTPSYYKTYNSSQVWDAAVSLHFTLGLSSLRWLFDNSDFSLILNFPLKYARDNPR